jgi:hypothetical protein
VHRGGYDEPERQAINNLLAELGPGEWGNLGLCYGEPDCPYGSREAAIAAGVEETFCPACRVIYVYRAQEALARSLR